MKNVHTDQRPWVLLTLIGCILFGFQAMFTHVRIVFNDELEDMSHGWLVVLFSLYVLWCARKDIWKNIGAPSYAGFFAIIPCVMLSLFGTRGIQMRFEQLGFIGLCMTIPWALFGRRCARYFVFPSLFLLFTIPLNTFLDVVTIHLRLLASGVALTVLKGFGLNVIQQGTAVISQGPNPFSVDVAAPCSGMRSIFALMALTAAYTWFTQPTWFRRGILFSCSVPLAILGNVTRILTICIVAAGTNQKFALGFYHDYSGYIVFIVAIVLMVACGGLIDKLFERKQENIEETDAEENKEPPVSPAVTKHSGLSKVVRFYVVPWLVLALLMPVMIFQGKTPSPVVTEAPKFALPLKMDGCRIEEVRYCQNEQCSSMLQLSKLERGKEGVCPHCGGALEHCSLGERTALPSDTRIMKRMYVTPYARFLVSAVIGGMSKSSIHRPELCMPAQGFQMRDPANLHFDNRDFRSIRLESSRAPSTVLSYTFFNQEGVRTSSHVQRILRDVWDRSVLNRIDRWVMITVAASANGNFSLENKADRMALEAFLRELSEKLP